MPDGSWRMPTIVALRGSCPSYRKGSIRHSLVAQDILNVITVLSKTSFCCEEFTIESVETLLNQSRLQQRERKRKCNSVSERNHNLRRSSRTWTWIPSFYRRTVVTVAKERKIRGFIPKSSALMNNVGQKDVSPASLQVVRHQKLVLPVVVGPWTTKKQPQPKDR